MSNSQKTPSQIHYSDCMVAYIDILGFRKMIQQADKLATIHEVMTSVRTATDFEKYVKNFEVHRLQVSDGLLFWAKIDSYRDYMSFMLQVGYAVAVLHSMKILTRGSFSYGDHYYKDEILVSPAFIDAHKYESEVAKYPRMILSPSFIERIESLMKKESNIDMRLMEFSTFYFLDNDGYRYFNYLGFMMFAPNPSSQGTRMVSPTELVGRILRHKEVVESGLENETDEYVRAKYIWLGNYHNNFLDSADVQLLDPNLRVGKKLLEHRPLAFS